MNSTAIFQEALLFEEKILALYRSADSIVDDDRGRAIFKALADDEQSHVDFLRHGIQQLEKNGDIDANRLACPLPTVQELNSKIEKMKASIPERMLGDIKTVLNNALQLENETSAFYEKACSRTSGEIRKVFEKFLEIERRHADLVQIELDHASGSGMWFNFMETSMETE